MFHLPTEYGACDVQIFRANGNIPQEWIKPAGKSSVFMMTIGPGGGGGGGCTGAAGTNRGGGGGGASGSIARAYMPLDFLHDTLFVFVPYGAAGGAADGAGSTADYSLIATRSLGATTTSHVLRSSSTGAGGGGAGTAAAGGAAGSVGVNTSTAQCVIPGNFGQIVFIAGQVGAAGGVHTGGNGTGVNWGGGGHPLSGGCGGAGVNGIDRNAGAIVGAGLMPTVSPGTGYVAGNPGYERWSPFMFSGGTGAGASDASVGLNGGAGAIGSGGGGGSAGTTGGAGGRGGDGLVVIISW